MATVLEGHPDNVAPAIYGGLSVSIMVDGKTLTNSIPIDDDLSFITVSRKSKFRRKKPARPYPRPSTTRAPSSTSAASASSFLRCSPSSTTALPMACRINCTCPTACASSPAANWSSRRPSKPVPGRYHQRFRFDAHRLCDGSGSADHGRHDQLLQRPRHRRYGPYPEMQQ